MYRLAVVVALGGAAAMAGPQAARRVWAGEQVNLLGGPSPDGRWLSYVDKATGDLAVLETATGRTRRVTGTAAGSGQFAYFSAISPDSKRIAYAWFNEEKFYELRVADMEGGEPRTLFRNEEAGFVQPCAWAPDGKQILTLLFRKDNISQIALIDSGEAGKFRVLKSLNWIYPNRMDYSPDGRFIVYDNLGGEGEQRDVFVLSADGSRETRLASTPANEIFPVWTRDGASVIYVSERAGTFGIWRQRVREGAAEGAAVLLKSDAGRILSLGASAGGTFYYGLRAGSTDVMVAEIDLEKGTAGGGRRAATNLAGRTSAPAWSRDGGRLAFLVRLANENFGQESRGIGIAAADGSGERLLAVKLAHIDGVEWSPDGKTLLASGSDRQNRRGLYLVNAADGEVTPVVQQRSNTYRGMAGIWHGSGQSVLYVSEGEAPELRERSLADGGETAVYRAEGFSRMDRLALSPGGRRVAFVASGGGLGEREEVRVLELQKGEARVIASVGQGGILGLEWAPDGEAVLVSTAGSPAALWRAGLEGGKPERLPIRMERRDGMRLTGDGRRGAYTVGAEAAEVWALDLGDNK